MAMKPLPIRQNDLQIVNKIHKFEEKISKIERSYKSNFFNKLKNIAIKCMMFDQQKTIEKQDKYNKLEAAVNDLIQQNEKLQDKMLYYEDLIVSKDHDLEVQKKENQESSKEIVEMKSELDEIKNKRRSSCSVNGYRYKNTSSWSERKQNNTPNNLNVSSSSKQSQYFSSSRGSLPNKKKSQRKTRNGPHTKLASKNNSMTNLKGIEDEKTGDVPRVEFDFSTSTFQARPQTCTAQNKKPMFGQKQSFQKYITPTSKNLRGSLLVHNFGPTKE